MPPCSLSSLTGTAWLQSSRNICLRLQSTSCSQGLIASASSSRRRFGTHALVGPSNTIVGHSGCEYAYRGVLAHRLRPAASIYEAHSDGQKFVVKRADEHIFDLCLELQHDFAGSERLRMHIDHNREAGILIFEYFDCTLFRLLKTYPDFPETEVKKVLRCVAEAVAEMHSEDWLHLDIKADNILLNWSLASDGKPVVSSAMLADCDTSYKLPEGAVSLRLKYAVGNVMWRSPEVQAGSVITKASDVFSFGLVCAWALGGDDAMFVSSDEAREAGMLHQEAMIARHFLFFGPMPEGLLDVIEDEEYCAAFKATSTQVEDLVKDDASARLENWDLEAGAKSLVASLTQLDPKARPTMEEVLKHPWWESSMGFRSSDS